MSDDSKDIIVEMHDDGNKNIEWDGLPQSMERSIGFNAKYHYVTKYPLQVLNMQLNKLIEDSRGPRPREEIENLVNASIEILRKNPYDYYD